MNFVNQKVAQLIDIDLMDKQVGYSIDQVKLILKIVDGIGRIRSCSIHNKIISKYKNILVLVGYYEINIVLETMVAMPLLYIKCNYRHPDIYISLVTIQLYITQNNRKNHYTLD